MKKLTGILFKTMIILSAMLFTYCAGAAPVIESTSSFKDVEGKEWALSEITKQGKTAIINRGKMEEEGMGQYLTINFKEGSLSGTGAPNRFFGPYMAGSNRTISTGNIASTMMAAFREPDEIKEIEYFAILSGTLSWDLKNGKLELSGINIDGTEAILVFTEK